MKEAEWVLRARPWYLPQHSVTDCRIQLTEVCFRRVGLRCRWGSAWTCEQLLGMQTGSVGGIHPGVGWCRQHTPEREVWGEESRDQGLIPKDFLCEQGVCRNISRESWALPMAFRESEGKRNKKILKKDPKEYFNSIGKFTIY